ncbi:perforin-1-like [Megalops cyprinoides]|uniref:perforin-1-like n=1 Tax=Megalops cyprinoides TaxID=118141 RepID=UPI001864039B|nr:perforin-1-like [Megalops cyprinoides]
MILSKCCQRVEQSLMEGLWRLLLLGWACHFLSCPGLIGAMIIGTPQQCEKAGFVPGYNLAGEGFDIVKMERKGAYVINMEEWRKPNGSCTLVENRYLGQIKQKLPVAVMDWRALSACKMRVSSRMYESSESLINDSTSTVTNNWKVGLDVCVNSTGVALGGTHSREALYTMQKSKEDKYSFTSHDVHCKFYRFRLSTRLPLQKDFIRSTKRLPHNYGPQTKPAYWDLIDTYGTHYIRKVQLGGKMKSVTAIQTCKAALDGLTDTAVKDCLDVEASATFVQTPRMKAEFHHCKELKKKMGTKQSFSSMFSDRQSEIVGGKINTADLLFSGGSDPAAYRDWLESLKTIPDVVFYSLKPLHSLMSSKEPAKAGLKKAIEDYILENALVKKCSESCRIGNRISARDHCACICNRNENIRSNCCPVGKGLATLRVYGLKGKQLHGDLVTQTDGFVLVSYGAQEKRTEVINNNDNPDWPESFEFGPVKINMATQLKFKVYDQDSIWNNELLGACSFELRQGTVTDTCMFNYGTLFFSYDVTCAPSLGGPKCWDYIPSPMSISLAKTFHSRNGVLAGECWFKTLGTNHSGGDDDNLCFYGHSGK